MALANSIASAVVDVSITINRVILPTYCSLTLAFIVLILEIGGDHIKKLSRITIVMALSAITAIAGWAYNSYA